MIYLSCLNRTSAQEIIQDVLVSRKSKNIIFYPMFAYPIAQSSWAGHENMLIWQQQLHHGLLCWVLQIKVCTGENVFHASSWHTARRSWIGRHPAEPTGLGDTNLGALVSLLCNLKLILVSAEALNVHTFKVFHVTMLSETMLKCLQKSLFFSFTLCKNDGVGNVENNDLFHRFMARTN